MQHTRHLPIPRRRLATSLAAALLGAALATTTYALIDAETAAPSKLVILEPSASDSTPPPTPMSGHRP